MQSASMFMLMAWLIPLVCIALAVAALMSPGPVLWFLVGRDRARVEGQRRRIRASRTPGLQSRPS